MNEVTIGIETFEVDLPNEYAAFLKRKGYVGKLSLMLQEKIREVMRYEMQFDDGVDLLSSPEEQGKRREELRRRMEVEVALQSVETPPTFEQKFRAYLSDLKAIRNVVDPAAEQKDFERRQATLDRSEKSHNKFVSMISKRKCDCGDQK